MITRYVPLGLLFMLLFLSCSTIEVKQLEENSVLDQSGQEIEPKESNLIEPKEFNLIEPKEFNLIEPKEFNLEEKINQLIDLYINEPSKLLEEIKDLIPEDNVDYNELIARLQLSSGDYLGAKKSISNIPDYDKSVDLLKIYVITQMSLFEEYSGALTKILSLEPTNVFALNNLAKVLISLGQFDNAENMLIDSYYSDPQNGESSVLLGDLSLAKVEKMGLKYKKVLNDTEEKSIKALYKRALSYYLHVEDSKDVSYYIKLSKVYSKLGKKFDAVKALNIAIELDPTDVWNYYDRGKLYFYMSANEKAIEDFVKAYELDPNHFFTNVFLGRLYFMEGETLKSFFYYKNAVAINPEYTPAFKDLSVLYYITGDKEESLNYLIRLYKSKTDRDPLLPIYLITSLLDSNRDEEAKKLLENLVKYENKGTMKGIYNYFLDPKHTGDQVLNDALLIKDHSQRLRLTYYVSCALDRDGVFSLSETLYKEVADANLSFESKLAKYKLGEINE